MHRNYETIKNVLLNIVRKYKDKDYIYLLPFVLLSLKIRLQYFFFLQKPGQSFPQAADSKWYLDYAYNLLSHKQIGGSMNDILYFGYNILLTVLIGLFKSTTAVLFIQTVTASLCVILVYKIARMLFNRLTAIIASYLYCYYAWPITLWSVYILSDSFFISLLLLTIYLLLKWMNTGKRSHQIMFVLAACYLFFFRPAGILAIGFIALYMLINIGRVTIVAFIKKYKWMLGGALTLASAAIITMWVGGKLDPFIASMQYNAKLVLYNVYAKGWIYDHPTPFDHVYKPDYKIDVMDSLVVSFIVNNWDHVSAIYAKRVLAFLGRWVWMTDLSTGKGLVKFASDILPTILVLIGTVAAAVNGLFRKASILWLLVLSIFLFCIVIFIDGMYRYKAPSLPFILIIAAYGAERSLYGAFLIAKASAEWIWTMLVRRRKQEPSGSGV